MQLLRHRWQIPVEPVRGAALGALAEYAQGEAAGAHTLLNATWTDRVELGIVIGGAVRRGRSGRAGSLGSAADPGGCRDPRRPGGDSVPAFRAEVGARERAAPRADSSTAVVEGVRTAPGSVDPNPTPRTISGTDGPSIPDSGRPGSHSTRWSQGDFDRRIHLTPTMDTAVICGIPLENVCS
ncbi:hypothetical protein [Streptomyces sp. BE303]|uniref:hypothetical protein n=1 Tax=Streptomyces sp. BE303 TaxID=3002528 RepID=UPI002E79CED4|nr:hypothetical protein [Streptomyces sp. BE303]MED7953658.1 hypothetical protein [Streptomyces sp. BE303]